MDAVLQIIKDFACTAPLAQEFYLLVFFVLGYVVFRLEPVKRRLSWASDEFRKEASFAEDDFKESASMSLHYSEEDMRVDMGCRRYERVLEGWHCLQRASAEALTLAITALTALGRPDEVGLFVAKAVAAAPDLRSDLSGLVTAIAAQEVDLPRQHAVAALRDLFMQARDSLDRRASEALLSALARGNDETCAGTLLRELSERGAVSAEALAQVVLGFLSCKNLDAALKHLRELLTVEPGARVATETTIQVARTVADLAGSSSGPASDGPSEQRIRLLLEAFEDADCLQAEALVPLLEWASRQSPPAFEVAERAEVCLRRATGGSPLPQPACNALVRLHAGPAGQQSKAFAYFEELAGQASSSGLTEGAVVGMISSCAQGGDVDLAERILHWVKDHGGCTLPIISATIKVLAAAKRPERICEMYEGHMDGIDLDDAVYGQLIRQAVQAGKTDLARDLFRKSRNPDLQNCISIIRACSQEGKVEEAMDVLQDLSARGEADTAAYNCALDACVCNGDITSAEQIFRTMKEAGRVDVVSYNILLKPMLGNPDSMAEVDALLQEMQRCGFKPTVASYNAVLGGALSMQDFSRAWRVLEEMDAPGGPGVDAYTMSILFKGYKGKRRSMDADSFDQALHLMRKHGVKMDEILVNGALEACMALRDSPRLASLLSAVRGSGWVIPKQCSMHTYSTLIKAYSQSRQLNMAWKLWEDITRTKRLVPSEQLYGQMIDVLIVSGWLDDALKLFSDMKATHGAHMGSQGFAVAYAVVIKGFAQRKECSRALELYEEMKECGVRVELVVLNSLIDACSRVGDMDAAARIFRDMVGSDCVPDLITYSTLIKGYCVRGELEQALELLALMRKKGIQPDAIVFNSILDGCAKQSMVDMCDQVLQDMEDSGVALSNHSLSILIKLYGRCHNLEAAFRVIDEMPQKYGFRPNAAVYTCLMSACIAHGRCDQAMELRTRMIREGTQLDERTYSTLLRGALRASCVENCVLLISAALDEGGRWLLDAELVQSALALIQRRRQWEAHGVLLLSRLHEVGLRVRRPDGGAEYQGRAMQAGANGRRYDAGCSGPGRGDFRGPPRRRAAPATQIVVA